MAPDSEEAWKLHGAQHSRFPARSVDLNVSSVAVSFPVQRGLDELSAFSPSFPTLFLAVGPPLDLMETVIFSQLLQGMLLVGLFCWGGQCQLELGNE